MGQTGAERTLLRAIGARSVLSQCADGELLERFVKERDPRAFEDLVFRHRPMVRSVCLNILRNDADAEDAFQNTFLVLLKKTSNAQKLTSIGGWLHGVAMRTGESVGSQFPRTVIAVYEPPDVKPRL